MPKRLYIRAEGVKVPVTEEIYTVYKRSVWNERKRRRYRDRVECSLDCIKENGYEFPSTDALVEEIVEDKLLLELLLESLRLLTEDERDLLNALYYQEKTEREVAAEHGVSQPTIHKKKSRILEKLKKILG